MRLLIISGWLLIAALTGGGLYRIAYEVDGMRGDLAQLETDIRRESESIHVLSAEWTYLARPARIAELAERYLPEMRQLTADRIGRIEDLPMEETGPRILQVRPRAKPAVPVSITVTQ